MLNEYYRPMGRITVLGGRWWAGDLRLNATTWAPEPSRPFLDGDVHLGGGVDVVLVEHHAEHGDDEEVEEEDGALLHSSQRVHVIYTNKGLYYVTKWRKRIHSYNIYLLNFETVLPRSGNSGKICKR